MIDYGTDICDRCQWPRDECHCSGDGPPTARAGRRVNLGPYLDGTWKAPEPSVGAVRDDGWQLLYAGRWHTIIGPTETGKTMLGLVHARDELHAGGLVVWAHFEEHDPGETVARLLALGVRPDLIWQRFVWLDCDRAWTADEFTAELADLPGLTLVGLDGINAACTRHGKDPEKPDAVGWYRRTLVTPATALGAAVVSLGHPVKDRTRQNERHGFGASAWLDEATGVAFRLLPGRTPIRRGSSGTASLYAVKDRPGNVRKLGTADTSREGWTYLGALVVDDTGDITSARISEPKQPEAAEKPASAAQQLATAVEKTLANRGGRYESERWLLDALRADGLKFVSADLGGALLVLEESGRLLRGPQEPRKARPGWLATASEQEADDD